MKVHDMSREVCTVVADEFKQRAEAVGNAVTERILEMGDPYGTVAVMMMHHKAVEETCALDRWVFTNYDNRTSHTSVKLETDKMESVGILEHFMPHLSHLKYVDDVSVTISKEDPYLQGSIFEELLE